MLADPRIDALIAQIEALAAQVDELVSSSFQSAPVGVQRRGVERLAMNRLIGRLGRNKPRNYAEEWAKEIRTRPENTGYSVIYTRSEFKLMYCGQHNASLIQKFSCGSDHRAIKSCFLVLGLYNYNCEAFCQYVAINGGVILCEGELSPEGSAPSRHGES